MAVTRRVTKGIEWKKRNKFEQDKLTNTYIHIPTALHVLLWNTKCESHWVQASVVPLSIVLELEHFLCRNVSTLW